MLGRVAEVAPLRRNVTLEDVGNAAAFLCSDLAAGITGEIPYVDAGFNTVGMSFPEDGRAEAAPARLLLEGVGILLGPCAPARSIQQVAADAAASPSRRCTCSTSYSTYLSGWRRRADTHRQ